MPAFHHLTVLFLAILEYAISAKPLDPTPPQDVYEFWLDIRISMTMVTIAENPSHRDFVVYEPNTKRFRIRDADQGNACNTFLNRNMNGTEIDRMVTADGLHRPIVTINGTLPGPTLVVYEGATVNLHINNNLFSEPITLHMHGLPQKNNFWNDGAGKVSQFPILPGETYTMTFKAEPAGTFWYHDHYGPNRADGIYGALVVLPRQYDPIPVKQQYVMVIGDWYQGSSKDEWLKSRWETIKFAPDFNGFSKCYAETRSFDGTEVGAIPFHAVLINGKGWWDQNAIKADPLSLPLENFQVQPGRTYKFRVISVSVILPMMLKVDGHKMTLVATDGRPINPVDVDYLIIYNGERWDFTIQGMNNPQESTYLIRVRTMEYYTQGMQVLPPNVAVARLDYASPRSSLNPAGRINGNFDFHECRNSQNRCIIGNCPFPMIQIPNSGCYGLYDFTTSTRVNPTALQPSYSSNFQEIFVNVLTKTELNGFSFQYPKAPPALADEASNVLEECPYVCSQPPCYCSKYFPVEFNSTMQIILANIDPADAGGSTPEGYAHPMHIHGHHFYVIKMGYPQYTSNGTLSGPNKDMDCAQGPAACRWTNPNWSNGRLPYANLENPVMKDTITVPSGGYAVLRAAADNPGWWMIHCHTMPHHLNGMAGMLRIGREEQLPPVPESVMGLTFGKAKWWRNLKTKGNQFFNVGK